MLKVLRKRNLLFNCRYQHSKIPCGFPLKRKNWLSIHYQCLKEITRRVTEFYYEILIYKKVGPKTTFEKTQCICVVGADQDDELYDDQSTSTTTTTTTTKAPQRVRRKITRATFASAFFPTPNPIDFSTVFSGFSNLDDNPLVFSVVLSIFGVYLLLLFWSRREDRKDVAKVCSDCDFVEFKSITINYFIFIFNTNQQYKDNFPP